LYGAHHSGYNLTEAELAFARKAYESCAAFISICGGIEIPLRAGITKGKKATGPRFMLEQYRQWEPETEWLEKRWVHDGKLWTSGALTNGQDLMHAFTHELWGDRINPAVKMLSVLGCWINRDVDYKDEPLN
jgi:transcriptional regulator GlxA family with amidase domain